MKQFNFTEARNSFSSILELAKQEGIICISKRDSESFYITPAKPKKSALDIKGVNLGLSSDDIVTIINESRESDYKF